MAVIINLCEYMVIMLSVIIYSTYTKHFYFSAKRKILAQAQIEVLTLGSKGKLLSN